jgi:hypothetical protein
MKPTSYWESRRSFWSTPKGAAIFIAAVIVLLIGGLIALNIYSSPFPVIEYFHASPTTISLGGSSNLSWAVIGASTVEIRPGIGAVELKGSRQVSPSSDTIYTLIAVNGTRNRSAETLVRVE